MQKVFYVPGQTAIIDYAREIGPNAWAARGTWLMLPEIQVRHPGAVLGDEVGFLQAQEAAHGTKPARITETRYDFALSRAQVLDYNAGEAGDSFILQAPEVGVGIPCALGHPVHADLDTHSTATWTLIPQALGQ